METNRLREFLHARSIEIVHSKNKQLQQLRRIVPMSDIVAALDMIENGTFEEWINEMEEKDPNFMKTYSKL